jgi:hypothetical protein
MTATIRSPSRVPMRLESGELILSSSFLDETSPEKMLFNENKSIFQLDTFFPQFKNICTVSGFKLMTQLAMLSILSFNKRRKIGT